MKNQLRTILFCLVILAAMAGCAFRTPSQTPVPAPTDTPVQVATPAPTPTAIPTAAPTSVTPPTSAAADAGATDAAKKAAQDYAAALESGDFAAASGLLSEFSLTAAQMTHGDASDDLARQASAGAKWSNIQVGDAKTFNAKTTLVHVTYQLAGKDAKTGQETTTSQDEQWPMRLENGGWRYNWGNLIDYKTLDVPASLVSGVTVKPLKLSRYSDRIDLNLLVQNASTEPVVWAATPSETIATFRFGDQSVDAEKNRLIFDTLRSYPDTVISVKGLYTNFPDMVDLRKFKNYEDKPWYSFHLTE